MTSKKEDGILNAVDWLRKLLEALVLLILGLTTLAITVIWGYGHVMEAARKDFSQQVYPVAVTNQQSALSRQSR